MYSIAIIFADIIVYAFSHKKMKKLKELAKHSKVIRAIKNCKVDE